MNEAIELLRLRLAARPRVSWWQVGRNACLYLFLWLVAVLAVYGLVSLVSTGVKAFAR
jgi:hypothetical protein